MPQFVVFFTDRKYEVIEAEKMSEVLALTSSPASMLHVVRVYPKIGDSVNSIVKEFNARGMDKE